ncbi:MAG TPA: hypothetical protein PLW65_04540 [Pseudomonadota bacterium]|nr:hypothetical protein [Pseudomonadota bacterium]
MPRFLLYTLIATAALTVGLLVLSTLPPPAKPHELPDAVALGGLVLVSLIALASLLWSRQ